jgi:hypothetical protein
MSSSVRFAVAYSLYVMYSMSSSDYCECNASQSRLAGTHVRHDHCTYPDRHLTFRKTYGVCGAGSAGDYTGYIKGIANVASQLADTCTRPTGSIAAHVERAREAKRVRFEQAEAAASEEVETTAPQSSDQHDCRGLAWRVDIADVNAAAVTFSDIEWGNSEALGDSNVVVIVLEHGDGSCSVVDHLRDSITFADWHTIGGLNHEVHAMLKGVTHISMCARNPKQEWFSKGGVWCMHRA